ncbi:MAG TPA: helix-turn-helix transcriptional regulator [Woeseiaceae bacterium]|jgi:DNA-binding Xre family transcriptional regulator
MKAKAKKTGRVGQRFDEFLKEDGMYEEVHTIAIKRVIAWQLAEAMKAKGMTKTEMAKRMNTSRSQLNRLLDPKIEGVELQTLSRAAQILGRNLRLELV